MYGYVYKTTYIPNGKIYVGQHKSDKFDESYYGSGRIIKRLLNSNPLECFKCEVICWCETEEELNEKEIFWIEKTRCRNRDIGYNISTGGAFGDSGYHLGMLGKKQSDKQKEAARKAKSKPMEEETKRKLSKSLKGNHNAVGHFSKGFTGKHTEETKRILSEKARILTTEYHKNLSEEARRSRGSNISNAKKGKICITDGERNYYISKDQIDEYKDKGYHIMSVQVYRNLATK